MYGLISRHIPPSAIQRGGLKLKVKESESRQIGFHDLKQQQQQKKLSVIS